jgi:hypothetical protein
MSRSNHLAKASSEFVDLEIVESEGGKPYLEIVMPRNSWVEVLRWCLEHRAAPVDSRSVRLQPLPSLKHGRAVTT